MVDTYRTGKPRIGNDMNLIDHVVFAEPCNILEQTAYFSQYARLKLASSAGTTSSLMF